jgi:hypothetical protein
MISRPFFAILILLLVSVAGLKSAEAVCFTDVTSYTQVRAQLPGFMQSGYLFAVHDDFVAKGAFRIVPEGNQFRADAAGRTVAGPFQGGGVLASVCVDGNTITSTFSSGASEAISYSGNSLYIRGFEFGVTDQATYQNLINGL